MENPFRSANFAKPPFSSGAKPPMTETKEVFRRESFSRQIDNFYTKFKKRALSPLGKYALMAAAALSQQACVSFGMGEIPPRAKEEASESMGKPSEVTKRTFAEHVMFGENRFEDEWIWLEEGLYLPESMEREIAADREEYKNIQKSNPKKKIEPSLRALVRPVMQTTDAVRPRVPETVARVRPQESMDSYLMRGLQPLVFVGQAGEGFRVQMRDVTNISTPYLAGDPLRSPVPMDDDQLKSGYFQVGREDQKINEFRNRMAVGEAVSRLPPEKRGNFTLKPWSVHERRDLAALSKTAPGSRFPETSLNSAVAIDLGLDQQVDSMVFAMMNARSADLGVVAAKTRATIEAVNGIHVGLLILEREMKSNPKGDHTEEVGYLATLMRAVGGMAKEAQDLVMCAALEDAEKRQAAFSKALVAIKEKIKNSAALQFLTRDVYVGASLEKSKNYANRQAQAVVVSGLDLPPGMAMPSPEKFATLEDSEIRALTLSGSTDDGVFDQRLNEIKELKYQAIQRAMLAYEKSVLLRLESQVGERKAAEILGKARYLSGKSMQIQTYIKADGTGPGKIVVVLRVEDPFFLSF